MIGRKSEKSLGNKRTLYLMSIKPVMMYASPVFAHVASNIINKLHTVQNKFCSKSGRRSLVASYEPPPAHHFLRRPWSILSDPPNALTTEVERLIEVRNMFQE
ncbi:hypothetical protein EVAR_31336_1 [Eumeta japonica]|uniref:RNA-directed DNA polymerase from mobile element jockey n=1 Tax=Eumeta variegata TaxID=151549 RepID=A0A4C1XXM9_EUMVA|nr:hypothetical protein EVAR_31336_1 [Eumeta japonica]